MESATLKIRHLPRNPNVRAYLAGGGATAALVTAAVIVFLGVAAFVGFNGLPFGADEPSDATLNVAGVPQAAATAAAPTADAVAARPATPSPAALAEIAAALPPGTLASLFPGLADTPGGGGGGGTTPGGEPTTPSSGALGNTVSGVEDTAGNLGATVPLGDLTKPVTDPIDETLNDSLNSAGGAVGNDQLGNQAVGSLNETTDGLLGPGGATDKLLGGGN